ncbi:sensor domain-containing protein [Mycobacterium xenopi]|uniref:Sensor domain-containing protein n=1 Tax=Mycobacterium xenopi TaxID=1789 RepID=A0AAD1H2R0_MYCXE|nr:lipoprotein LpqA [Mycobacterium xenopi RIVM700367]ORX19837.1 hypothetical protein AWC32_08355 [Mycobacterium xenopi]BBU23643.1 sensor domain-containing protein [Mycobacterium xenopi]SPX89279.1 lipoprotein LpqA [Mycobacterium xenopi]
MSRPLLVCCAALLAAACTRVVGGAAVPAFGPLGGLSGVDVDDVLLDQSRMRAITGTGDDLTIIPSMDGKQLVDLDSLAATAPPQCRFVYADTAVFGPDVEQFHKTTFQAPPKGALISEGAAGYRDADTARRSFEALVGTVEHCAATSAGWLLVGEWSADADSLHTRPGACGRDYRVKASVLVEVTFCGFPESVPDIVMTNITAKVPG